MWVEITETTKPEPGNFIITMRHPMRDKFDKQYLYLHPALGWLQPGLYNPVLFPPTHWWDEQIKK